MGCVVSIGVAEGRTIYYTSFYVFRLCDSYWILPVSRNK
jgi:hypothetical protein